MEEMVSIGAVKISKEETPMSKVNVASTFREIILSIIAYIINLDIYSW